MFLNAIKIENQHLIKVMFKQARKGFRPISASEILLVRKVNDQCN